MVPYVDASESMDPASGMTNIDILGVECAILLSSIGGNICCVSNDSSKLVGPQAETEAEMGGGVLNVVFADSSWLLRSSTSRGSRSGRRAACL